MDTYEKKYNEAMLRADEAVQKGCLDKDMFDIIFPPEESEDEVVINGHKVEYDKDKDAITMEAIPNDLEEAAKAAATEVYTYTFQGMDDLIGLFKAGAKWQKEQMLKEAVDTMITTNLAARPTIYIDNLERFGFKYGDKVHLVIIKEG